MAQCPVCQTENADDFGLVNCSSCGSPFFITMEGVEAPMAAAASPEAPPEDLGSTEATKFSDTHTPNFLGDVLAADPTPEAQERPLEDMAQIADFGNSEESLAREGAYRFTVFIRGIDTAEIRQDVREQLSDSRFLWDIEALLSSIQDGELVLQDISAVKAALAVQRLKLLPVELKWEQHAIHQSN